MREPHDRDYRNYVPTRGKLCKDFSVVMMLAPATWICMAMVIFDTVSSSHRDYCREKCPPFDPQRGAVLLPGPSKVHFYRCYFGVGILFRCPRWTHFNPKRRVCDRPRRACAVVCRRSPDYEHEGSGDGDAPFRWS